MQHLSCLAILSTIHVPLREYCLSRLFGLVSIYEWLHQIKVTSIAMQRNPRALDRYQRHTDNDPNFHKQKEERNEQRK